MVENYFLVNLIVITKKLNMENQVSIKRIVIDFIYIREQLKELFKDKKEYKPIIDFLLKKDYLNDELDIPFPKLKEVEAETGLKPYVLRKLLLEMHNQIFNYIDNFKLSFNKVLYHFNIKYFDSSCYFTLDKLEHLPRIGESISLPFVSAKISLDLFYVEDVRHEFENYTQNIYLTLKVGQYNEYWRFMKDRAHELNEIPWQEFYSLTESQLKSKIYSKNPYR